MTNEESTMPDNPIPRPPAGLEGDAPIVQGSPWLFPEEPTPEEVPDAPDPAPAG